MSKKRLILGIETSCDETAASLITENDQGNPLILSNVVSSQVDIHKEFGGVVPELAARSHIEKIDWIVEKAIKESGKRINEIDGLSCESPKGAFYLFVRLTKPEHQIDDKKWVLDLLHQEHVLVVHGSGFSPEFGAGHFRMVCLPPIPVLEEAFRRIERFLSS